MLLPARCAVGLPRMWPAWAGPSRIIPARAGFTSGALLPTEVARDHPRSRGVYTHSDPNPTLYGGSSPLARGLQGEEAGLEALVGIIPARAGFTYF